METIIFKSILVKSLTTRTQEKYKVLQKENTIET